MVILIDVFVFLLKEELPSKISLSTAEIFQIRIQSPNESDSVADSKKSKQTEKWYTILLQISFPFLAAGFGMVGAGLFLDHIQVKIRLLFSK